METENWKDIEGYEGLYQVSNLGRVKSLNYHRSWKEQCLKPGKVCGYLYVILSKDGEVYGKYVHILVAEAFIPNPFNLPYVNHKDEVKTNNCVSNLEWCTAKYNTNYGTGMRRMLDSRTGPNKEKQVLCVETGVVFISAREASRQTGASQGNITSCCQGKRNTAGGYHWQYAD